MRSIREEKIGLRVTAQSKIIVQKMVMIRWITAPHKNLKHRKNRHWIKLGSHLLGLSPSQGKTLSSKYPDYRVYSPSSNKHQHIRDWKAQQMEPSWYTKNTFQNIWWPNETESTLCFLRWRWAYWNTADIFSIFR